MKTLIAVISYQGDSENGNHDLIRQTWGKDIIGADLKFFIGRRSPVFQPQPDEVLVDFQKNRTCQHAWWESYKDCCVDFWQYEMRDILRWSIEHEYDFTFLCSTDTYLIPKKLMATGFEKHDYSGHFIPRDIPLGAKTTDDVYGHKVYLWAPIGLGFFLSKKASQIVLDNEPDFWYSEVHVGQVLGPHIESGEISAAKLGGFLNGISWHFRDVTSENYKTHGTGWMQKMYKENL